MIDPGLLWRNSLRKPTRLVLTCGSILVAFFLFTMLAGVDRALTNAVDGGERLRLMTRHTMSITRSLPLHYQQKIQAVPGVEQVTYSSWFGGFFKNADNKLALTAVDSANFFVLYPEFTIPVAQLDDWQKRRRGLLIGQAMADKYQWKVGDSIPLKSSIWMTQEGSFSWDFVVAGIYSGKDTSTDTNRAFMQHRYFDETRAYNRDSASWFSTVLSPGADVAAVARDIDTFFANSVMPTETTTEQLFLQEQASQFADMGAVIRLVVAAVFFTLMLIVCNTMAQTIRERMSEIAMMKAVGFSSLQLVVSVYLESLLLLACGALAGAVLATVSLVVLRGRLLEFLPGIAVDAQHYALVVGSVVLCAVLCTAYPAFRIKRLDISRTLGEQQ